VITVRINTDERDMTDAIDEQWINQQINRRRAAGETACVRVTLQEPGLNVLLTTPGCAGGGGSRPPIGAEQAVIDLWRERGLDRSDFTGGNVVAFLKQLRRVAA
jgi:hypothetical protein